MRFRAPYSSTLPLDPVSHLMLATHESLRRRGYCGLPVLLIVDLDRRLLPEALAEAVRRVVARHVGLAARVRFSPVWRRAFWEVSPGMPPAERCELRRLVCREPWEDGLALLVALNRRFDPQSGPQFCLWQISLPDGSERLALVWPHYLMDLEGAVLLLQDLNAALRGIDFPSAEGESETPDAKAAAAASTAERPFRRRFPHSYLAAWRGRLHHAHLCLAEQPRLVGKPRTPDRVAFFATRRFDAGFRQRYEAWARSWAAPGPLRYVRPLLVAAAQTYRDMAREKGRPRARYLFSHALPLPRDDPRQQLHGNQVLVPWFSLVDDDLDDAQRADATLLRQAERYLRHPGGLREAVYEMLHVMQRWPFPVMRALADHRSPRGAAGCTTYRFGDGLTTLGDARITNLTAVGTMNCHPGWILAETTFRGSWTLAVTAFQDYVPPEAAEEYLDRLEARLRAAIG